MLHGSVKNQDAMISKYGIVAKAVERKLHVLINKFLSEDTIIPDLCSQSNGSCHLPCLA